MQTPLARFPLFQQQHPTLQQGFDLPGKERCAGRGDFDHLAAPADEVRVALLMGGFEVAVIRGPAIVRQRAGKVAANELIGRIDTSCRIDQIGTDIGRGGGVQPSAQAADTPARLIAGDLLGLANGIENRLVFPPHNAGRWIEWRG